MIRIGILAAALIAAPGGPARASGPVVGYTIINGAAITASLTGAPGDAARGRALYAGEARAGCPACHGVPGSAGAPAAAPDLSDAGGRLSEGTLRLWIVAPEVIAPGTSMPAFYAAGQRDGAEDPLYGGPALTASEVEDLVSYLASLGEPQ
jgi:sulfur-oxidizing protein SoxX